MNLYFDQIIGLPLQAIIKGEALAAQSTVDFIKQVGFEQEETGLGDGTAAQNNLGKLRSVTFTYETTDIEGNTYYATVSVPLLSLIPIPVIQVNEAELDYAISITGIETNKTTNETKLLTTFKNYQSPSTSTETYNIKINVKVGQSDVPAGISKLFSILENNITQK